MPQQIFKKISLKYFHYFVFMEKKKRKKKGGVFQFEQTWVHFSQECFVPVWPQKIFKNFLNVFSLFHYYLPLEKSEALHLSKLESTSPKDALCQV